MNEWVWSNGGMILTGEKWSTGRKTLCSLGGRWMNEYGAMVEWYWQGNTEVLGEKHYTAWVVDGWISMVQWWNDTEGGKLKYWRKRVPNHLPHHTSCSYVLAGVPTWPSALKCQSLPVNLLGTCWCWLKVILEGRCYANEVINDRLRSVQSCTAHVWICPVPP